MALRFNKTPHNAESQSSALLRYVSPALYQPLKAQLSQEDEKMKTGEMTTSFFIVKQTVTTHPLCTHVSGEFHATVKQMVLPVKRLTYHLCFSVHDGYLLIRTFDQEI